MTTSTFQVQGMTCGHCVSAVRSEIGRLSGVSEVTVDLDSGKVTVTAEQPLDDDPDHPLLASDHHDPAVVSHLRPRQPEPHRPIDRRHDLAPPE